MVNYLYPRLQLAKLPDMLILSVNGALFAGSYGILHDPITYSISPEYFTRQQLAQH
jgi:hypothetical protein